MPFDWKYNVKKIAESVPKPEVSMDAVEDSSLAQKFEHTLQPLVSTGKEMAKSLAYSALADKEVQKIEDAEMGRQVAKSFGAGQTGQSFAALLAQYGPSVMSMVTPGPKAEAASDFGKIIRRGLGDPDNLGKVIIVGDKKPKSLGKIIMVGDKPKNK